MDDQTDEMPAADDSAPEQYPGLEFTPPQGTIGDELEGDALVKWKKVGDKFTIVEFEGKPMAAESESDETSPEAIKGELQAMDDNNQ